MSTQEKISLKIKKIQNYIEKIRALGEVDVSELNQNDLKRAGLERYLYLMSDSVISLLQMLIVLKGYQTASAYNENVYILHEHKEITEKQFELLMKIIGFRNVLSHDYEKLNLEILADVANNGIGEIEELLSFLKSKI